MSVKMGLGAGVIIDPLAINGRGAWAKEKYSEPVENLGGRVAARKRRTSILQVEKLTSAHLFFKDLAVYRSDPAKFPMSCRSMRLLRPRNGDEDAGADRSRRISRREEYERHCQLQVAGESVAEERRRMVRAGLPPPIERSVRRFPSLGTFCRVIHPLVQLIIQVCWNGRFRIS